MLNFNYILTNDNYELCEYRLNEMLETLINAINFNIRGNTLLAVRLDFSIPNVNINNIDMPSINIYEEFDKFMNRLRAKRLMGQEIRFVANWKKEYSSAKGRHIHTVFYFDPHQFATFGPNTKLFRLIKQLWEYRTDDCSLPSSGYVNIIPSYLCETWDEFRAKPSPWFKEERFLEPHYYTILTNDPKVYRSLGEFHQQKHQLGHKCGFLYWISYLAKKEQESGLRRSIGTTKNALDYGALPFIK